MTDSDAAPSQAPPLPVEIGRYQVQSELGRGGMGVVYRVWDPVEEREVALKILLAGTHADEAQQQRFSRELTATADLDHPALMQVYDQGQEDGLKFFIMPLITGPSLRQLIDERGYLPAVEAAGLLAKVARGLHCAHDHGLIHRDVKPANILLTDELAPVLTDFGLVLDLDDEHSRLTASGQALGTPAYMAPEQLSGQIRRLGPRTDIYALGAVLYRMVTGKRPYSEAQGLEALVRTREDEPPPPHAVRADVPREISHMCTRAMEFEPEERYPSAAAFADDLERFVRGARISHRGRPARVRIRRWARRNRWRLSLGIGVVAAALAALVGSQIWQRYDAAAEHNRRERRAEERRLAAEQNIAALTEEGRLAEADALFKRFAALVEHRNTRALARGWLNHGDRMRARGDSHKGDEVTAYSNAYALAKNDAEQDRALVRLAEGFRRDWQWAKLDAVLDTLATTSTDLERADSTTIDELRAAAAFRRRDMAESLAALAEVPPGPGRDAQMALARHLSVFTDTGHRADYSTPVDRDGDGRAELVLTLARQNSTVLVQTDAPHLPELASYHFPEDLGWGHYLHGVSASGQSGLLVAQHPQTKEAALLALPEQGGRLVPIHRWPEHPVHSATRADLDGDGTAEIYVGVSAYGRYLLALQPRPDGSWATSRPHPETDDMYSDVEKVLAVDLNRDGRDELVVTLGAWNAYDIRVLTARAEGGLTLSGRRKMGVMRNLAAVPVAGGSAAGGSETWVAALKEDLYGNASMFSPESPTGEPAGIYLFSWRPGRLQIERHLPMPLASLHVRGSLTVGDFNGDGHADLTYGVAHVENGQEYSFTIIYLQLDDGTFREVIMRGLYPLAAVNADEDRAHELVVYNADDDARVWVLGAGEQPLEGVDISAEAQATERAPVPSGLDHVLSRIWRRAEDLAVLGLRPEAAEQLLELSALVVQPDIVAHARWRAASLLEGSERCAQAAELYEQAVRGDIAISALAGAARCWDRVHRLADAQRVLTALLERGDVPADRRAGFEAQLQTLEDLRAAGESLDIPIGEVLGPAWRIETPVGIRRDPAENALRVDIVDQTRQGSFARLPVYWSGERLTLEVEFDIEILEFSGSMSVLLRAQDGQTIAGVGMSAGGGGWLLERHIGCVKSGDIHGIKQRVDTAAGAQRVVIRLDLGRRSAPGRCTVASPGDSANRDDTWRSPVPWMSESKPGMYEVALVAHPKPGEANARASALVRRIRIDGVRAAEFSEDETAAQRVFRALSNGQAERALDMIDKLPTRAQDPATAVLKSIVLDELGLFAESDAALTSALKSAGGLSALPAELQGYIHTWLRLRPERLIPILRQTLSPAQYFAAMERNWSGANALEWLDGRAQEWVFTVELRGLRQVATPDDRTTMSVYMDLLRERGRALRAAGRLRAARADALRAIELIRDYAVKTGGGTPSKPRQFRTSLAYAHVELAAIAVADSDIEGALGHIERVFEVSRMPDAQADFLAHYPGLEPLHKHPRWHQLVDRRRGLATSD